jgi:2-C-methyl-D-erythritol 4-phosphate cytidylyltransferase
MTTPREQDGGPPRVAAIVLAGGSGTRFGGGANKVYLPLAGEHLITWSLRAMASLPGLVRLVLVIRDEDRAMAKTLLDAEPAPVAVDLVDGGATRHESEYHALRALSPPVAAGAVDVVVIHDGARPLPSPGLVRAVVDTAARQGGAVPGIPAGDLVEVADDATVRRRLGTDHVRVQTPQAFAARPLLAAYDAAAADGFTGTDTSACVQRYSQASVRWVPGEVDNIKVTLPTDLAQAEAIIRRRSDRPD